MIKYILVFTFLFSINSVYAQTQEWASIYTGPNTLPDVAKKVVTDNSGNIYVTGYSHGGSSGNDYATVKYDQLGIEQWVKRYNGTGNSSDGATSMCIDNNGNIYVTGTSSGTSGSQVEDFLTIKYNSAGDELWVKRYNGQGNNRDEAVSIAVDNNGNVYVTGWTMNGNFSDYATIKYDASGNEVWVKTFNNGYDDMPSAVVVDASGNIYVTGFTTDITTSYDYLTIKYNTNGSIIWQKQFNRSGAAADTPYDMTVDAYGVYITGSSELTFPLSEFTTVKYDTSGVLLWSKGYKGPVDSSNVAYSVTSDNSGNIYVTGSSAGSLTGNDCATIKYNSAGDLQWVQRYNGTGNSNDLGRDIITDAAGNIYVTGYGVENGFGIAYNLLKYNSAGVQQWVKTYNGAFDQNDFSYSVALDNSNNIIITGTSATNTSTGVYATVKYSQPNVITNVSSEIPSRFLLSQNYPNPFNPVTNIEFSIPKNLTIKLGVYDMLGREIESLVNQNLNAGTYKANWDATKYSSGIYYYKISAGEFTQTKKMVLLK